MTIDTPRSMKPFLVIWIGQLISMLGSGLTGFALGVWIFDQTHQATPFALTILFGSIPRLLLLPVAGSLADRWNRRFMMILSDTGSAILTLIVAILIFFGDLQVWHIYLISIFGSIFASFQEPAYSASVTMLVPKKELGRANGLVQMGQAIESIATPLLAGALFVWIGLSGILVIDFVTFFFAIGALIAIHIPQPEPTTSIDQQPGQKRSMWADIRFGFNYLWQRSGLLGLLLYYAMVNFLLNWTGVLIAPMILSQYSPTVFGMIQTTLGLGMLLGSIVMSAWGGPKRRIPAVIGFIAAGLVGYVITGMTSSVYLMGVGAFVLMFFIPLASANSQAVFQAKVAPDVQGRVFSIRAMISRAMMPIAFLTAGPLADYIFNPAMTEGGSLANTWIGTMLGTGPGRGVGLMFVISGLTGIVISLFVYANPRIRNIEDELPDAIPDAAMDAQV